MTEHDRIEVQALCARAAVEEAKRQAAQQRGDWHGEHEAERELRRLWHRHAELAAIERVA